MVEFTPLEPVFLRQPASCLGDTAKSGTNGVSVSLKSPHVDKTCFPKPQSLEELIFYLREELGGFGLDSSQVNPQRIMRLMEDYASCESDWKKYAHFDPSSYTRNLVDSGNGKFNLLVLAWSPGQASPIHDHSGSHCIMKILGGELQETVFSWPDSSNLNSPCPSHTTTFRSNQVTYMHDQLGLHRMANNTSANAVSLHLYTPPINHANIFHDTTGRATRSTCSLYSVHGNRVIY